MQEFESVKTVLVEMSGYVVEVGVLLLIEKVPGERNVAASIGRQHQTLGNSCLLYTSDAADE